MELLKLEDKYGSLIFKDYKEAKEIAEENGFKVIRPFDVKDEFLKAVKDLETANDLQFFDPYSPNPDKRLLAIWNKFENIVLKESRSNTKQWSTLNDYLSYRSGCFNNWFYPSGKPKS